MLTVGCFQSPLVYDVLRAIVALEFRRLYAPTFTWARMRPNVTDFARRTSTWLMRSPYSAPGAMRLTFAVGTVNARPSVGLRALAAPSLARISGPIRFCQVPLALSPNQGSG